MTPNYQEFYESYQRGDDPKGNATLRFIAFYADVPFDDFVLLYKEHESLPGIQLTVKASGGSIEDLRRLTPTMTKYIYSGKPRVRKVAKPTEPTRKMLVNLDLNDMEKTERELRAVPEKDVKYDPRLHRVWKLARAGMLTLSEDLREMRLRAISSADEQSKTAQRKLDKIKRLSGLS